MEDYKLFKTNIRKSPVDERDFSAETIHSSEGELPEELDLRADLLPVRNQGQQAACAGFTAANMKEWQELKDIGFKEYMSPQFIYNQRMNQDTEGMYSRDVMKILHKIGSASENDYPYHTLDKPSEELLKKASGYKIQGYAAVSTIEGLKKALYLNGPCYIAVPVYNYGRRMWKPKQGDVMDGGHSMSVVGYNKDGFVIRNSWGEYWGDNGYTIFPYEDWGLHWEVWTTIDEDSDKPLPPEPKPTPVPKPEPKPNKKGFWARIWDAIKGWFRF